MAKKPKDTHKLHIIGHVEEHVNFTTRLDPELNEWITENTTGSKNSVINFLVRDSIDKHIDLLKTDNVFNEL